MIYLGTFAIGTDVFYAANFHTDQGTIADPTSPTARLRNHAGTWSSLTTPAKQDSKTGHFGGVVDTDAFSAGQHVIRLEGTVATAKTVATEFSFNLVQIPELTGVPSATPSLEEAISLLYMKARNARVTDSATGEDRISNDAGTVILEQDFTDAANVLTKSKVRVP